MMTLAAFYLAATLVAFAGLHMAAHVLTRLFRWCLRRVQARRV
jgi:hypothetical protein